MITTKKSQLKILVYLLAFCSVFFFNEIAFAEAKDLTAISTNLTEQIKSGAKLIIMISYIAGIGFALGGVIQFKAHKDNPQQVPLSKPIVLLVVGACLLFLPTIITSSGQTIFGGGQKSAGEFTGIVGGSGS